MNVAPAFVSSEDEIRRGTQLSFLDDNAHRRSVFVDLWEYAVITNNIRPFPGNHIARPVHDHLVARLDIRDGEGCPINGLISLIDNIHLNQAKLVRAYT